MGPGNADVRIRQRKERYSEVAIPARRARRKLEAAPEMIVERHGKGKLASVLELTIIQ